MTHHAAFGQRLDALDVVIIDEAKPMQSLLRSMLAHLHPRRIRTFDQPQTALDVMLQEPPNLILMEWMRRPVNAARFLDTLRDRKVEPLCTVPVIVVTANATRRVVERAMRHGAHMVLVKPVAPSLLTERILHVIDDPRPFVPSPDGQLLEIEGVRARLKARGARSEAIERARQFREQALSAAGGRPVPALPVAPMAVETAEADGALDLAALADAPPPAPTVRRGEGFARVRP